MEPPTTSVWSDKTWQSTFCLGAKRAPVGKEEKSITENTWRPSSVVHSLFVSQNVGVFFYSSFIYCSRNFLWSENRPLSLLETLLSLFVPLRWQHLRDTLITGVLESTHANKANKHTAGGRCTHLATRAVLEVCWQQLCGSRPEARALRDWQEESLSTWGLTNGLVWRSRSNAHSKWSGVALRRHQDSFNILCIFVVVDKCHVRADRCDGPLVSLMHRTPPPMSYS